MIKFRRKITNPISVIAIFAFISETSAAVSLPFLDNNEREIYIWFLISFPFYLLFLFFITLNFNYRSLYAPSDFGNDKSFLKAFDQTEPAAEEKNSVPLPTQTTHDPPEATAPVHSAEPHQVQLPKLAKTLLIIDARELGEYENTGKLLDNLSRSGKQQGRIVLLLVNAKSDVSVRNSLTKPLKQTKKTTDRTICIVYDIDSQDLSVVERV
ncbi:hypothetical protein [Pseudomonas sp. NPDC089534]|uniref:hypothetical protein n=1 Tax=Pseudomonas sp. NPDC089534 TaxID=3364468 RepID=UPI00382199D3